MPNPASSQAIVEVGLPSEMKVKVELFDVNGKLVQVLENGIVQNNASIELNVENLASGTYTVRMQTTSGTQLTRTLTVQK
jgi:5-hydroxyisourate hydrolase-like protein (transthyretin family)